MIPFDDIQTAFEFVSSMSYGTNSAYLHTGDGRTVFRSEMGEIEEDADEDIDGDEWIKIPHKNDLDLGQALVFEFVEARAPTEYYKVEQIFRKRGAYGRFKDFLDYRGLLQDWYDFENQREEKTLRRWCDENGIEVSG